MSDCIFCAIARGDIPAQLLYEDDALLAFRDIHPQAAVHFLVIPKQHIPSLAGLSDEHRDIMGRLMVAASRVAAEQGCEGGFRSIINAGRVGGQEVGHLHVHILGGPDPLPAMLKY